MSRFDFCDEPDEQWVENLWRGQVASALRSKRGQAALRELRDALLAMPVRRLDTGYLATMDGEVCALGQLYAYRREQTGTGRFRAIRTLARRLNGDWADYEEMGCFGTQDFGVEQLGLSRPLANEIAWANDERWIQVPDADGNLRRRPVRTPEERWEVVFQWVTDQIHGPELRGGDRPGKREA